MTTPRKPNARGGGRPWRITQAKIDRIIDLIRGGNYMTTAVAAAGITYQTFLNWQIAGQELIDNLTDDPAYTDEFIDEITRLEADRVADLTIDGTAIALKPRSPTRIMMEHADRPMHEVLCVELVERLLSAEAEAEAAAVLSIVAAGRKDWRASAAYLKMRHGDRWREQYVTELTGPEGGPVAMSINDPAVQAAMRDPDARAAASALLAAIAPSGPSRASEDDDDDLLVVGDFEAVTGDLVEGVDYHRVLPGEITEMGFLDEPDGPDPYLGGVGEQVSEIDPGPDNSTGTTTAVLDRPQE